VVGRSAGVECGGVDGGRRVVTRAWRRGAAAVAMVAVGTGAVAVWRAENRVVVRMYELGYAKGRADLEEQFVSTTRW
jgi:hypothetical protein